MGSPNEIDFGSVGNSSRLLWGVRRGCSVARVVLFSRCRARRVCAFAFQLCLAVFLRVERCGNPVSHGCETGRVKGARIMILQGRVERIYDAPFLDKGGKAVKRVDLYDRTAGLCVIELRAGLNGHQPVQDEFCTVTCSRFYGSKYGVVFTPESFTPSAASSKG